MIVLETHVSSMGLVVLMGFPNALWPTHKNCKIEDALRLLYEHCAQTLDLGCYLVYHVYLYLFKTQAGSQLLHIGFCFKTIQTCFTLQPWDGDAPGELNVLEMDSLTKLVGHHGVFFIRLFPRLTSVSLEAGVSATIKYYYYPGPLYLALINPDLEQLIAFHDGSANV